MNESSFRSYRRILLDKTVLIASIGYLIDMFDLFLFNILRVKSLSELGLTGSDLTSAGLVIVNAQLFGLLVGSYLSGIVGDRWGRKSCLLLSILIYSVGSICSAYTGNVEQYAVARFFTGLGLAGELGQGVTLISEHLSARERGVGILTFFMLGFLGVILAGLVSEYTYWRTAYILGGCAGLLILFLRGFLDESKLFSKSRAEGVTRGGLGLVLRKRRLAVPYIGAIFLAAPAVFAPQLIWTLSPELARGFGISDTIRPHLILSLGFASFIAADALAMILSERLQSRRKATLAFLLISVASFIFFLISPPRTLNQFYLFNCAMGLTSGVWVVGVGWVAEFFATNVRSTITTTIPNFSRGLAIPMNIAYGMLKDTDAIFAIAVIGGVVFVCSYAGWLSLKETYGRDLDFLEKGNNANLRY